MDIQRRSWDHRKRILLINQNSGIPRLLQTNLVAEYRFDEGSGIVLTDYKNGYNGAITGATWATEGLSFNGSTYYVDLGTTVGLDFSTQMTVMVVLAPTGAQNGAVFSKWTDSINPPNSYTLLAGQNVGNNKYAWAIKQSNLTTQATSPTDGGFSNNEWHVISGVANGTNVLLRKNKTSLNSPVAYNNTISSGNTQNCYIARFNSLGLTNMFSGKIAYVAVYDTGLTTAQLDANYEEFKLALVTRGIILP